jgi:hypothetical protein
MVLTICAATVPGTAEAGFRPLARRLVYTTDSLLVRGQATVEYEYGTLHRMSKELPYDNTHAAGQRQFRDHAEQEVLRIGGDVDILFMPHYFMEAYIETENWRTVRAVRWKKGFPDVLLDFLPEGEVLITRAKPVSSDLMDRIGGFFQSSEDQGIPEFEMGGPYDPVRTGCMLNDLMTVLLSLEKKFTSNNVPPQDPFYISAMRKGTSNIYVGRFGPTKQEQITVEVNGETVQRSAVRCEVTLSYGHPVDLQEEDTIASLASRYMPDKAHDEAVDMIKGIVGAESLDDFANDALVVPVSVSVYNALHDSDKDFEGPFGLSESVTLWVDAELGIPLRAEGRLYGLKVAIELNQYKHVGLN